MCSPFAQAVEKHGGQIGFVLTGGCTLHTGHRVYCLDLDEAIDEHGAIAPWADEILDWANSYTEVTVSGRGMHVWVAVRNPPAHFVRAKVHVAAPAIAGQRKRPQLQVFGYGVPQYVTVSGNVVEGLETLNEVDDMSWLMQRFGLLEGDPNDVAALPHGDGKVPTMGEIEAVLRQMPHGAALLAGDWHAVTESHPALRDKSASEVYHQLVTHTLRAARNHGHAAVQFLLEHTAWGRGDIEDSADPSRYMRESWVAADVARASQKRPLDGGAASPFQALDGDGPLAGDPPPTALPPSPGNDLYLGAEDAPTDDPNRGKLLIGVREFLKQLQSHEMLVHGVLPRCGVAQVFGPPASGKTPVALSLALAVANPCQASWCGHEVDRHGKVVYLVGEDPAGVHDRLLAEGLLQSLDVAALPILVGTRPAAFLDATDTRRWAEGIEEAAGGRSDVALIVLDTQSRHFGAGDENDAQDMAVFLRHLAALSRHFGCLVLLIHHPGHGASGRGRGSSVQGGDLDAVLEVSRNGDEVRAVTVKAKNWAAPEPLIGKLEVLEVAQDRRGRSVTAVAFSWVPPPKSGDRAEGPADADSLRLDTEMAAVLKVLASESGKPMSQLDLTARVGFRGRRNRLTGIIERLVEMGLLSVESGGPRRSSRYWVAAGWQFRVGVNNSENQDESPLLE